VRLVLTNRCCQVPERGVASSSYLQVTSRGPVCVLIVQGLLKAQRANSTQEFEDPRWEVVQPRGENGGGLLHLSLIIN
jgi:hypothetical protein